MDFGDIIKLILFLGFFVLPPILKASEEKRKKGLQGRRGRPNRRPAPREGQTLSQWIEEIRKVNEGETAETPAPVEQPPTRRPVAEEPRQPFAPIEAQVSPVQVDIETRAEPVEVDIRAHVNPIHSRFGTQDISHEQRRVSSGKHRDDAHSAKNARRAKRERGRTQRARRSSGQGKASIRLRRSDLKRAMLLKEILLPPLALREDGFGNTDS